MDAKEDVLDLVKGVGDLAVDVADVADLVKGAQDALDAEDLVLVHVHRKERVRLVPHAIVVLAVLVRVLHVHLVRMFWIKWMRRRLYWMLCWLRRIL